MVRTKWYQVVILGCQITRLLSDNAWGEVLNAIKIRMQKALSISNFLYIDKCTIAHVQKLYTPSENQNQNVFKQVESIIGSSLGIHPF